MSVRAYLLLVSTFIVTLFTSPTSTSTDLVYFGCTQQKYTPGSTYESNLNSLLTSLINSAMSTTLSASFNKFTIPSGSTPSDTINGLYQCRGDLAPGPDCGRCVARAVTQLVTFCPDASGGALQLDGCFIKFDNTAFLGAEDKTVVYKRCGPTGGIDADELTRRDAVLGYLSGGTGGGQTQLFRVAGSGSIQGVAQCVGDLSAGQCQDCVAETIGRLRSDCGAAAAGDVFLGKCYARYWEGRVHAVSHGGRTGNRLRFPGVEFMVFFAAVWLWFGPPAS